MIGDWQLKHAQGFVCHKTLPVESSVWTTNNSSDDFDKKVSVWKTVQSPSLKLCCPHYLWQTKVGWWVCKETFINYRTNFQILNVADELSTYFVYFYHCNNKLFWIYQNENLLCIFMYIWIIVTNSHNSSPHSYTFHKDNRPQCVCLCYNIFWTSNLYLWICNSFVLYDGNRRVCFF